MKLVERLERAGNERLRATASDVPGNFLKVYAQISRDDGRLFLEAAAALKADDLPSPHPAAPDAPELPPEAA